MSGHTPGPWEARYSERFDNYQIYGAGKIGLKPWICNTKCESVPAHHEANARLIAAAPELLDALITALPYVEEAEPDKAYEAGSVRKVINQMREAISKASPSQSSSEGK